MAKTASPILPTITIGQTLTCAETGKEFIAAHEGVSFNFARGKNGEIFSNEGVDLREKRELLDRSKPFVCYLSCDGKTITGWKNNALGKVANLTSHSVGFRGFGQIARFNVQDLHGQWWAGRGAGKGMICTLRAMKHAPKSFYFL